MELVKKFEKGGTSPPTVKIGDVYLMKLLCETIFRDIIVPNNLRRKRPSDGEPSSPDVKIEN
jgi:hypothetical protein